MKNKSLKSQAVLELT